MAITLAAILAVCTLLRMDGEYPPENVGAEADLEKKR